MENPNETNLKPSGQFAEFGATEVKPAAKSAELEPSGRFAELGGSEVRPAGSPCPTCGK